MENGTPLSNATFRIAHTIFQGRAKKRSEYVRNVFAKSRKRPPDLA